MQKADCIDAGCQSEPVLLVQSLVLLYITVHVLGSQIQEGIPPTKEITFAVATRQLPQGYQVPATAQRYHRAHRRPRGLQPWKASPQGCPLKQDARCISKLEKYMCAFETKTDTVSAKNWQSGNSQDMSR